LLFRWLQFASEFISNPHSLVWILKTPLSKGKFSHGGLA
jgi:hypothetical protein